MRLLVVDGATPGAGLPALLRARLPGCEVWVAASEAEALEKARLGEPDVVLLEAGGPGLDGFRLCRALKADDRTARLPLLFVAGGDGERALALEAGADALLARPVNPDELPSQVRVLFRLRRAEQALRDERELLEARVAERTAGLDAAQRLARVGSWEQDLATRRAIWSPELFRLVGRSPSAGAPAWDDLRELVHPEDRDRLLGALERAASTGEGWDLECRLPTGNGPAAWARHVGEAVQGVGGRLPLLRGTVQDVSDQRRAEEQRNSQEAQLRQAQKMEAIGRLAGGIAHDFNSLITVIINYASFATESAPPGSALLADLAEIRKAGERAAALTRQLLVFSRKQVVIAEPVDLNATVAGMRETLRRLLGEQIELDTLLAPDLAEVLADRGLIGQVVLNLVANARDAMPEGGRVTVETVREYAPDGPGWVELRVTDTGHGMSEEIRTRCFEPFFTTKPMNKGTGLGLAVVYGIVEQCGGSVSVRSAPGQGATFSLRFPCTRVAGGRVKPVPAEALQPGKGETILLVEDDEGVRRLAVRILTAAGHHVLAAGGAEEVEALGDQLDEVRLLLTDVVMPRVGGRALAERLRAAKPGLKVLYMSGYPHDDLKGHGMIPPGVVLLSKPFTPRQLVVKVQEALAAK